MSRLVRRKMRCDMYRKWLYVQEQEQGENGGQGVDDDGEPSDRREDDIAIEDLGREDEVAREDGDDDGGGGGAMEDEVAREDGDGESAEPKLHVIFEGDDPYRARGYYPHVKKGKADIDLDFDFPQFTDEDVILYYQNEFSLASWYNNHRSPTSRWLQVYRDWGFPTDRMTREASAILQSIVTAFIDHLDYDGPHGKLLDMRNYVINQYVENYASVKRVRFFTRFLNKVEGEETGADDHELVQKDIKDFKEVLTLMFEGGNLDQMLNRFLQLVSEYPFKLETRWKVLLLRNYPGFWNVNERVNFYVMLHNRFFGDHNMTSKIQHIYSLADSYCLGAISGWTAKIIPGSVLDHVLRKTGELGQISTGQEPMCYRDGLVSDAVHFGRATLQHFDPTPQFS